MKKQINPTIKAHLIRGAFYLLLLVAVCAIPFALAQRNAIKRRGVTVSSYREQCSYFSISDARRSAFRIRGQSCSLRIAKCFLIRVIYAIDDGTC